MSRGTGDRRGRATTAGSARGEGTQLPSLTVSGDGGVYFVHRDGDPPAFPDGTADLLRAAAGGEQATVVVGVLLTNDEFATLPGLLAPLLEAGRRNDLRLLRLVMSGGGANLAGRTAPARVICEEWGIDVVAPGGVAVLVPDGSLFAPGGPGSSGGWWQFSPGLVPRRLGTRYPTPGWESPLERVAPNVAEGHLVQPVPAGLLVQPLGAPPEGIEAIRYAVPADPSGPLVLVGVPGAPPVSADALASVLAALPKQVRHSVRLLPADGRDLLAAGQEAADSLGLEVQVDSGLPVLLEEDAPDAGTTRMHLVGADGAPSWQPYVQSVSCVPSEGGITPAPRLNAWRAPAEWLEEGPEPGVLFLDKRWQVTLTRAGMWVGPRGERPVTISGRVVDSEVMAIDLGMPGRALDETVWPLLDQLFGALEEPVRDRAMIQIHGNPGVQGLKTLRRLAVRHGLTLAPKGWRSPAAANAADTLSSVPLAGKPAGTATPAVPAEQSVPAPLPPATPYVTTSGGLFAGKAAAERPTAAQETVTAAPAAANLNGPAAGWSSPTSAVGAHATAAPTGPATSFVPAEPAPPARPAATSVPIRRVPPVRPQPAVPAAPMVPAAPSLSAQPAAPVVPAGPVGPAAPTGPTARPGQAVAARPAVSTRSGDLPGGPAESTRPSVPEVPEAPATTLPPRPPAPAAGHGLREPAEAPAPVPVPQPGPVPLFGPGPGFRADVFETPRGNPSPPVLPQETEEAAEEPQGAEREGAEREGAEPDAAEPPVPSAAWPWPPAPDTAGAPTAAQQSADQGGFTAPTGPAPDPEPLPEPPRPLLTTASGPDDWARFGSEPLAAVPVPEQARVPVPEQARVPVPEQARVPVPEQARVPVPEQARVPVPEQARVPVPEQARVPVPEQARVPVPEQARVPVPGAGTEPPASPASVPVAGPDAMTPPAPRPAAQAGQELPRPAPRPTSATEPGPGTAARPAAGQATAFGPAPAPAVVPEAEPAPDASALRTVPFLPVRPSRRSTVHERSALRAQFGENWNRHQGAVQRALTRLPGLRSTDAQDELTSDLAAVHAYVNAEEGRLSDDGLRAGLSRRDEQTLIFLSCLAAGLRRLPSYRGTAIRPAGVLGDSISLLLPGEELGEATSVSALALSKEYASVPQDHYLIWSMTGRRAGALADADGPHTEDEIFFAPGTRFRILEIHERAGASVVLLRELNENAPAAAPGVLDSADLQVLDRLRATADQPPALSAGRTWPARCTGPLGMPVPGPPGTDS